MIFVSSWFILKIKNHNRNSISTKGIIVDYLKKYRTEPAGKYSGGPYVVGYAPIIDFKTFFGETMRFTSSVMYGPNEQLPEKGSKIEVLYDPTDPTQVNVAEGIYKTPTMLLLTGILLFTFYLYNRIKNARSIKNATNLEP